MKINFEKLLDKEQRQLINKLIKEANLQESIEDKQKISKYNLKDLLINCGKEEIEGLIYNLYIEKRKNNKEKTEKEIQKTVFNKISKILPQDIICTLPEKNNIKKKYYEKNIIILNNIQLIKKKFKNIKFQSYIHLVAQQILLMIIIQMEWNLWFLE